MQLRGDGAVAFQPQGHVLRAADVLVSWHQRGAEHHAEGHVDLAVRPELPGDDLVVSAGPVRGARDGGRTGADLLGDDPPHLLL